MDTSRTTENVRILKEAYRKWREAEGTCPDCWMEIIDDNISFGSMADGAPPLEFSRGYSRRDQLVEYFDAIKNDWTMVRYDMDEFLAQGDVVAVRGTMEWINKKTNKPVKSPKLDYWRMKDGKAVEYYEFFDTAQAMAAASPS